MHKQITTAVLGGAMAAAFLAGCSAQQEAGHEGHHGTAQQQPAPQQPARHAAAADIAFAQGMIPHHQQAVQMAELAEQRAGSQQVRDLAARIKAAQGPEIQTLTGWLEEWGAPQPSGHHHMDGMMSQQQMDQLAASSGADFDRRFLELMIAHHEGAVRMAEQELGSGSDPEARRMAQTIAGTQRQEIDTMRALLGM